MCGQPSAKPQQQQGTASHKGALKAHREGGGVHAIDQLEGNLAEAQRLLQADRLAAAERRGCWVDGAVRRKRLVRQPQVQLVRQLVCVSNV